MNPGSLVVSVPSADLADDLAPLPEGVDVVVWDMTDPAPRPRIDVVVPPYTSPDQILPRLDGVQTRLVQSQSIGYEGIADLLPPGHVFANATTVHETSTAELALALVLACQRRIPDVVRAQQGEHWTSAFTESLADRRVLLLGYGGVGKAVAARLAPFEVEVVPVARSAREENGVQVRAIDELPDLLPNADILILTLPGGDETRRIIDDRALAALPDDALVVNVGRGALVDTDALVDHAGRGRIRAALDVTDPEPLPPGHPLWTMPGVLISPHIGGASTAMRPRLVRLIREQLSRLQRGEAPVNVVLRT